MNVYIYTFKYYDITYSFWQLLNISEWNPVKQILPN